MKNKKQIKERPIWGPMEAGQVVTGLEFSETERKHAEERLIESEERYRTAIEHSNDGVALVRGMRHIYVNQKFLEIFGYDNTNEIIGNLTYITVHPDDREMVMEYNRRRQEGEAVPSQYEFRGLKKDGTIIFVEVSVAATVYQGKPCSLAYLRDVTPRKITEEKLKQHQERLEELVEERTNDLKKANEQLKREIAERKQAEKTIQKLNQELEQRITELKVINKELKAFGYSITHDLKTPLVTIGGFSRRLIEKYAGCLDEKGQKYLRIINMSSAQMEELTSDFLSLFKAGSRIINQSHIRMDIMAQEIFLQFKAMYPDRILELSINTFPETKGDKTMIRQVMANLLSNAFKYSRLRDVAIVEVGGFAAKAENVYYVKDNGVGFPIENAHKIFDVFERLHASEEYEGTGLGLTIVRHFINRHGGRVWAEGKPDGGATFYFTLPNTMKPSRRMPT